MSSRSFSVRRTVSHAGSKRRCGAAVDGSSDKPAGCRTVDLSVDHSLFVSIIIAVGIDAREETNEISDSDEVECAAVESSVTEADSWGNGDSDDDDLFWREN